MRSKIRIAVVAGGAGALVVLLLLVATAVTRSGIVAAVAGVLGALLVIGVAAVALRVTKRSVRAGDRTSTRLAKLEASAKDSSEVEELKRKVAQLERTAKILRDRVPAGYLGELQDQTDRATHLSDEAWRLSYESAIQAGRHPRSFLSPAQAKELFDHYLAQDRHLEIGPLIRAFDVLSGQDVGTLRSLYRTFRATGYWDLGALTLRKIAQKSGQDSDRQALAKLESEIALFGTPTRVQPELPAATPHDPSGPIVHMVGKVLPETQTGYTLRTHYTALAQSRRGLAVAVVGQTGITEPPVQEPSRYTHEGVEYHLLPGSVRGSARVEEWLRENIEQLARLARELRPSVLHAHSDFYNALIVHAVGTAYGIPTVYETRGFWEETWLTRAIASNKWGRDAEWIFSSYGRPAAYELRKHAEEVARSLVDHDFTLAGVMRDHILESARGGLSQERVSVVPNAAQPDEFPVQDRDVELAARLGLQVGTVTVGYISSMVEYEGIDTLIDAVAFAQERLSQPINLLLVGDGPQLESLRHRAEKAGVQNVIFTGAVPHEDVLRYYGMIDIFVVPRGSSSVANLVTPLKPFEAFATGRAVILSDVAALQEIADQSGAVETFRAGYHRDLGRKITALVRDPERRRDLGVRAARWVRSERTWDANVSEYHRVYRELGYRGPADKTLGTDRSSGGRAAGGRRRKILRRDSGDDASSVPQGGRGRVGSSLERSESRAVAAVPAAERPLRVVVVAMKPQIAGRIRRNILTLLEMGAEVIVVNTTPRDDFFQGLVHPRLSADFVDVRSLAVRYQARMTRKNTERKAVWAQQRIDRAAKAKRPDQVAPGRVTGGTPGADLVRGGWIATRGSEARQWVGETRRNADKKAKTWARTSRRTRDLAIRDQLKQVHLVNRFAEFWRLSPDRIAQHEPDLVVSSDLPGLVGASIAAQRLGIPHLHDCHELYLESTTLRPSERKLLWPVEKRYMRRADSVVVVNETIRDEYRRRYGVEGIVLRNAAPAVPDAMREAPVNLQALAGIPQEAKVVLYQGGLVAGRGLDVCVRAAAAFPEGVHLIFIGKGRMLEELQTMARELGVTDRVHWLPAVEPADLPGYTAGADLGVIPYQPVSRNNQFALPNKAFEYTGAGIPFVASDLVELRRIVEVAGCGEVYDPYDPAQLAVAVRAVLDEERYPAYRLGAEDFGRENTWETEREILVAEIRRLAGDRGRGRE